MGSKIGDKRQQRETEREGERVKEKHNGALKGANSLKLFECVVQAFFCVMQAGPICTRNSLPELRDLGKRASLLATDQG